ncbi:cytochrome P450 [Streptomyces sp. NPDC050759]|uniref:cytochrome P450 n=1 Tax=Streptomyces sp. NPDC050759 TaxID=3365635 RepID=UPI0037ABEAEE
MALRENAAGILALRRDQVGYLRGMVAAHGDIFRMRMGGFPVVMVNHPDYVQDVLVNRHENYDKENFLYRAARAIVRDGIVTSIGGAEWQRRRKMLNPAFHRPSIARFVDVMTEKTGDMLDGWGRAAPAEVIDVSAASSGLALKIVLSSLFGAGTGDGIRRFERAFFDVNEIAGKFFRFPFPPLTWRTPSRNRLRARIAEMDAFIHEVIAASSRPDAAHGLDLFTLMLDAVDEETGARLTAEQLASEVMSMIVGGFETSSNSIAWIYQQLAEHPEVQRRVQSEVDEVLGGRPPTFADLSRLVYTRRVVDETLRMFTPAWQTMRRAAQSDQIGGYRIRQHANVYINFFTLHRHPEFWPDPDRFDPDRFSPQASAQRPRHAYQPFASGPRHCIGKHFGLAELQVTTAMLAQRFHVEQPQNLPSPGFDPLLTLHPKNGIHLRLRHR